MTNEELRKISLSKKVDRITLVTDNIHNLMRYLTNCFHLDPWTVRRVSLGNGVIYNEAILPLAGGMELQAVEPVSGDSVYMNFLRRFGKGIMGVRERISAGKWEEYLARCAALGVRTEKCADGHGVWLDLTDRLGGMICLIRDDSGISTAAGGHIRICQICIVTDDILRTAHDMSEVLQVGPWEIGKANNKTFQDLECSGYAAGRMPENSFLVGIVMYGSLQFELIQPQKGPLPYFAFLNRRGVGFHHIKQMLPTRQAYEQSLQRIKGLGLKTALAGKIGPCPWHNWATEDALGFVFEMNDNTELTSLPEGYDPYFVQ